MSRGLFPEERKGYCKGTRGTRKPLYMDQHILKGSKMRRDHPSFRSTRTQKRVLETWGDLLSLKLRWKTVSLRWCEKLARNNNDNNDNNNRPGGIGSWRTGRDYPKDSMTEKNPGDLRGLAVTQTPVKNLQLILMWKTLKE